jgi:hypothetical protein
VFLLLQTYAIKKIAFVTVLFVVKCKRLFKPACFVAVQVCDASMPDNNTIAGYIKRALKKSMLFL